MLNSKRLIYRSVCPCTHLGVPRSIPSRGHLCTCAAVEAAQGQLMSGTSNKLLQAQHITTSAASPMLIPNVEQTTCITSLCHLHILPFKFKFNARTIKHIIAIPELHSRLFQFPSLSVCLSVCLNFNFKNSYLSTVIKIES